MLRRVLPLALVLGCRQPPMRTCTLPPPSIVSPQVTIRVDPLRFKADATLTIELVIDSGYRCTKYDGMLGPSPAPCPAPPPDIHEQYAEPVAGRRAIVIASGQLIFGRGFTVIVTGPAAEGCDLLRGTARGEATGGAVEAPPLEQVTIPQPCPA
jgi:hypothetical protein